MSDKHRAADIVLPVEDFVRRLDTRVRSVFLAVRAMLVSLGPDLKEEPHPDEVIYARARPFLIVRHVRGWIWLLFPEGEKLNDPLGRLLHKGRERHVRLDDADSLDGHVQGFIREAYVQARS